MSTIPLFVCILFPWLTLVSSSLITLKEDTGTDDDNDDDDNEEEEEEEEDESEQGEDDEDINDINNSNNNMVTLTKKKKSPTKAATSTTKAKKIKSSEVDSIAKGIDVISIGTTIFSPSNLLIHSSLGRGL